jgi:hypothetical protein
MALMPIFMQEKIMNNLIYQDIVEDIRNYKCSDSEIEKLLEMFIKAIDNFTDGLSKKY